MICKVQKFYMLAIINLIIVIFSEICSTQFEKLSSAFRPATIIFYILKYALSPIVPVFMAKAINNSKSSRTSLITIPAFINCIFVLLSAKFNLIFYVSDSNTFHRGNFYIIYILCYVFNLTFLFLATLKVVRYYQNRNRISLYLIYFLIVLGTMIQIVFPRSYAEWSCMTITMVTYYAYYSEVSQKVDIVTELFNRYACESYISRIKKSSKGSIIFIDINDFKIVNDNFGHQYGDYCLKQISKVLKDAFNNVGLCYRYGGDELCVISSISNKMVINKSIVKFIDGIEKLRESNENIPTVAIGHAYYNKHNNTIEDTLREADDNMYAYKKGCK